MKQHFEKKMKFLRILEKSNASLKNQGIEITYKENSRPSFNIVYDKEPDIQYNNEKKIFEVVNEKEGAKDICQMLNQMELMERKKK